VRRRWVRVSDGHREKSDVDDSRAVVARHRLPGRTDEAGRSLMADHGSQRAIDRRAALRAMAAGAGAAASALWVGELALLADEQAVHAHLLAITPQGGTWTPSVLSARQMAAVGALVELIIPTTDTPGAKAALVDRYVDGVLSTASDATR